MSFTPNFDDPFQKLIHQQAVATMQKAADLDAICMVMGSFRRGLIDQGFSEEGAEGIARELFVLTAEIDGDNGES